MEHSLHLSVKHFVQAIALSPLQKITKKIKSVLQKAQINGEIDLDMLDDEVVGFSFDNRDDDSNEDDDDTTSFSSGDSLGKALALFGQECIHQC